MWRRVADGGIAPHILNLGTKWGCVVSFMPQSLYFRGKIPRYPLDRGLGGPQSRSGRSAKEKNSIRTRNRTPASHLVPMWTELPRFLYLNHNMDKNGWNSPCLLILNNTTSIPVRVFCIVIMIPTVRRTFLLPSSGWISASIPHLLPFSYIHMFFKHSCFQTLAAYALLRHQVSHSYNSCQVTGHTIFWNLGHQIHTSS